MKNLIQISVLLVLLLFLNGCGSTESEEDCNIQRYEGYGRYTMIPNCTEVEIGTNVYKLNRRGSRFELDGHTLGRGIYRKTKPWLYVHEIDSDKIDITFDMGSKDSYPLDTGSSATIFDVYRSEPWDIQKSTVAEFEDSYFLVSHIFSEDGVYFDLQRNIDPETNVRWLLVEGNIFVKKDGTTTVIDEINTIVEITEFNYDTKTAKVKFTEI